MGIIILKIIAIIAGVYFILSGIKGIHLKKVNLFLDSSGFSYRLNKKYAVYASIGTLIMGIFILLSVLLN